MKKQKPNLAAVEQAIAKKYGIETIHNPSADWSSDKETEYLAQRAAVARQIQEMEDRNEKVEVDGVLIPKKLLNKETGRTCPVCLEYSFSKRDDIYMTKYECCNQCYIRWVEDREDRWRSGWRPAKENSEE